MSLLETNRYLDGPTDIVGLKVARKRLKTEISAIGALAVEKQKKRTHFGQSRRTFDLT